MVKGKTVLFLWVAILVLAIATGFLWVRVLNLEKQNSKSGKAANQPTQAVGDSSGKLNAESAKKVPVVTTQDHIFGSKEAKVFMIVYTDLECPFCKVFDKTAREAVSFYKGQLAMVFRHFPLDTIHPKARTEAEATECVFSLGGEDNFFKYTEKIFQTTPSNNGLDLAQLSKLATQVGVNQSKFNACLEAKEFKDKVNTQAKGGETAGVSGTPGVFVVNKNGATWLIPGAVPLESLKQTIDLALK